MGARRGNGEGTITKRTDGRWEARLSLGDGKRKCYFGKTRQAVARKLTEAQRDRDKGLPIVGDRQTVAQYLDSWLSVARSSVRLTTWMRYEQFVRLHIVPSLGKFALSKLTPQQLQSLYVRKLESGLSSTTVHHLHMALHCAFDAAVRLGLVQRNICDLVDPPAMRETEYSTLTPEQVRVLLAAARGDRFEALYAVVLSTGMREGELLALKWSAVDLDQGTVQVRATIHRTIEGFTVSHTKTARSRRKLVLTPTAIDALRRHRVRQAEERLARGEAWEDQDLVFPNTVGKPMEVSNFARRCYKPLLKKASLPDVRFHDLRHTAATLLLLEGVHPKIVSEMLGHASVSITLDIYSHVIPDMQRTAMEAMERVLTGDASRTVVKTSQRRNRR